MNSQLGHIYDISEYELVDASCLCCLLVSEHPVYHNKCLHKLFTRFWTPSLSQQMFTQVDLWHIAGKNHYRWSMCISHVINMHQSLVYRARPILSFAGSWGRSVGLHPALNFRRARELVYLDRLHQSHDHYVPVMWSLCTSHVINMHQSCDQ